MGTLVMKPFMLILALYSDPSAEPSMLVMPGTYTKAECHTVKQKFDRDHEAYFGDSLSDMEHIFVDAICTAGSIHEKSE